MSLIIDVHALQSVPPSNLNRDDSGSPKSAFYGGVRRHRVSSQAWKRAIREEFATLLDASDLGYRTKRVVDKVAEVAVGEYGVDPQVAQSLALEVVKATGITMDKKKEAETGALAFLSAAQIHRLAEVLVRHVDAEDFAAAIKDEKLKAYLGGDNSVDISLFGRMSANEKDLNVDAACQVAHALSTHAAEVEFDYFTAVDDFKRANVDEDAGAAMIGTVEFTSSTLYRYANVDVERLAENLGSGKAAVRAVEAFLKAFALSVPNGKSNTFANKTLPDALVVSVRSDRAFSLVGAFERPVVSENGYRVASAQALARETLAAETNYLDAPELRFVVALDEDVAASLTELGERVSLPTLVSRVTEALATKINEDSE